MESFISWIGGKKFLRKKIIAKFPENFERYVEVFGGAGWVLFGSDTGHTKTEVFNDINGELVNLFRCVKYHCGELQRELNWLLNSRETFYNYRTQAEISGFTDIQRAARYFYLIRHCFGADIASFSFATRESNFTDKIEYMSRIHKRLEKVVIENKSYDDLIKVYDRKSALFYLDPPYVNTEKYYKSPFSRQDHEKLSDILKGIKGKFVLSYNYDPLILGLYKDFNITEVNRKNTLKPSHEKRDDYKELIITNY